MQHRSKILGVQYLRGFAALGVVLCHYGMALSDYPAMRSILSAGQIGVPIFFLISGFIIVYSLKQNNYNVRNFLGFMLKRSIRIDPPYWATILLYVAFGVFLNHVPSFHGEQFVFSIQQLIAHILYIIPFTGYPYYNHIFWTLSVEFQFYLLVGLFYFSIDHPYFQKGLLLIFGLANLGYYHYDGFVLDYSSIFAMGISFMSFYRKRTLSHIILPAFFLGLVVICHGVLVSAVLLASCLIIILADSEFHALLILGDISYSLYLTHSFVWEICMGLFKRLGIIQFQITCLSISVMAALCFACLVNFLIERPAIRLSKRFSYSLNVIT